MAEKLVEKQLERESNDSDPGLINLQDIKTPRKVGKRDGETNKTYIDNVKRLLALQNAS